MTTKTKPKPEPFFVGYFNKVPKPLISFLTVFGVCFLGGLGIAALALSSSRQDPGDGHFQFGNRFEQTGYVELRPFPVFRAAPSENSPARTYMLSGQGKRGVFNKAREVDGQAVVLRGVPVARGDLTLVQVRGRGGMDPAEEAPADFTPSDPVPLGKWRISGEICDGKCYAGAMRPGRGLAHKACANLCLFGGIPPVFVSSSPVEGRNFFLLADKDGNPPGENMADLVALYVELEGEVERLDDLMIFKADLEKAKVLR